MIILSIETSCDETAVSLVEAVGDFPNAKYEILGNGLWSQIDIHREYGGVFPALAKREHAATLVSMLEKAVREAGLKSDYTPEIDPETESKIRTILEREPSLADNLITFHKEHGTMPVGAIAVTAGPGLEPALWVGVNFAKALALLWNVSVIPVNHMEGHILASIFDIEHDDELTPIPFPAVSLLISGGHTELILMKDWIHYEKIGQTRDDAVGEAYDKVARLMGLPYPGGPEISKLANEARKNNLPPYKDDLPTPMLHSGDLDFSFSGLKTAVRYAIADKELSDTDKKALARDFEDVVRTVLIKKTEMAINQYGAETLIIGGGVSANQWLMNEFKSYFLNSHKGINVYTPSPGLATDNSIMIALAGHAHLDKAANPAAAKFLKAKGNRSLSDE
ncbi:tRNA (adenosine(37)-N6)-threonylcarbamoyltransferase complex transferase subunit TsaD [Candidatus Kaiserbacteria bacterium]|nr:tRNA (adenosine(37)-N6)-threonylcarbamoyltransferase complex transferase subunit TsaD [Candidatus Kaiserbacteria bacterium]